MVFQATHRHLTPLFNLHRYILPVLVIVGDDARHDDVVKVEKVANLLLLLKAIILHRSSGWSMMTINQTDVGFFNKQPRHNFYSTQIRQTWRSCLFLRIAFARSSFACLLDI